MIKRKINNYTSNKNLIERIKRIKQEKNATLLAHYYQIPEIQKLADLLKSYKSCHSKS